MIGFTVALGDIVAGIFGAVLWVAAGIIGEIGIGIALLGGGLLLWRRMRRGR